MKLVQARATGVDGAARRVLLDGARIEYDRLVIAPGVDIRLGNEPGALPGYDQAAAGTMPHAWKARPQTTLLRNQPRAMPGGGTVVMAVPGNSFRCPPGSYERASLIA